MNGERLVRFRQMWRDIDLFLEDFYGEAQKLGTGASRANMKIAQMRGLENLVVSTRRFSEIANYIKNQAGRQTRSTAVWRNVAGEFLRQLDRLENKARQLGGDDAEMVLDAKLRLARGWIKQVVAHYLFEKVRRDLERDA